MQIDFHHTCTYALARLTGFAHGEARIIAYSAQYVDDAKNEGLINFNNHEPYNHIASAHTVVPSNWEELAGFRENLDNAKNEKAWLPFHFLPGNGGLGAQEINTDPMVRRLICQPDSHLAARMNEACINARNQPNGLHRFGITAHVYADTFTHYGFVGLDNPINKVGKLFRDTGEELGQFLEKILKSSFTSSLPLGHGMVLVLPDQPFRVWSYQDRDGNSVHRNNTENFLHACQRLFELFHDYRGTGQGISLSNEDKASLQWAFSTFTDENEDVRHSHWYDLLAGNVGDHLFSFGALGPDEIASLHYVAKGEGSWKFFALATSDSKDSPSDSFTWSDAFEHSDWKRFHDAAKEHRDEVLDRILKEFSLDPTA